MISEENTKKKRVRFSLKRLRITGILVGVVLALAGLIWLMQQLYQTNLQRIDPSKYQVVYLTNGQAYFGKLQNTGGDFLVITSPYTAQSVKDSTSTTDATTTLLRVKDQVYGPEDSISIKSSQVTFWQNLRDDSKVTQAIKSKE